MQKTLLLASVMLLFSQPKSAAAQNCITGEGNIFNETVLIGLNAINTLDADDRIVAYASAGCIGSSSPMISNPDQTAIALTIWQDDDLTPEIDGLLPGEAFRIYAEKPNGTILPLVFSKPHEPDGIFEAIYSAFDTTMTAFLDSLEAELITMETTFDLLVLSFENDLQLSRDSSSVWETRAYANRASRDSLQVIVNSFPDAAEVQDLRDDLADANTRIAFLEGDLVAANGRVSGLLNAFRNFLNRMRNR